MLMFDDAKDLVSVSAVVGSDVPILRDLNSSVVVVEVEVPVGGLGLQAATDRASSVVTEGLRRRESPVVCALWFVDHPRAIVGEAARRTFERRSMWAQMEMAGHELPRGRRREWKRWDDSRVRRSGLIEFEVSELPRALEVTRTVAALCLLGAASDGFDDMPEFEADSHTTQEAMLRAAAPRIASGVEVLRAFGRFDDREVAVQVFSDQERSELLLASLQDRK